MPMKKPEKTKYKDLTAEDIKEYKEFHNISDELAQKMADAIRIYTEIVYNCFSEQRFEEQKAKLISINKEEKRKAA
jgi:hypothetical protein